MTIEVSPHNEGKTERTVLSESQINQNTYLFPFCEDNKFIQNRRKAEFALLAGPSNTIPHVEMAKEELIIDKPVTVIRSIPSEGEMWRIIPSLGIACQAPGPYKINLFFDPDNENALDSLSYWSGRQIAHELCHIARIENQSLHNTLLDALVGEGLGVYYEEHWQGHYAGSVWGHALSLSQIKKEWDRAQDELYSNRFHYGDWFWGQHDGHERFCGYSLGNVIVSNFFRKFPRYPMNMAARLPSQELLAKSGYMLD